jgi:hypothetical protein
MVLVAVEAHGELAQCLDQPIDMRPLDGADGVAKDAPEQANIVPQRLIQRGGMAAWRGRCVHDANETPITARGKYFLRRSIGRFLGAGGLPAWHPAAIELSQSAGILTGKMT